MRKSAGILLYRFQKNQLQVFLVHPGGPFWKNKDLGVWSIPKGEFNDDEEPLTAAIREFCEETGTAVTGAFMALNPIKQKAGKLVYGWGLEGNIDPATVQSNTFKLEWPPKSGKWQTIPEVDKGDWFLIDEAKQKINPAQVPLINDLVEKLGL